MLNYIGKQIQHNLQKIHFTAIHFHFFWKTGPLHTNSDNLQLSKEL